MKRYITFIILLLVSSGMYAQDLSFLAHPADAIVCENGNQLLSFETDTADYYGAEMIYHWFEYSEGQWNIVGNDAIHTLNSNQLMLTGVPESYNQNAYYCEIIIAEDSYISDTATLTVNPLPEVDFSVDETTTCFGDLATFNNNSPDITNIVSWQWTFNDPLNQSVSPSPDAVFVFGAPDSYNVELTGTDINGCQGSGSKEVKIHDIPTPSIYGADIACSYQENVLFQTDQGYSGYSWNLTGDTDYLDIDESTINTSDVILNCLQVEIPRQYEILITVTDDNGCNGMAQHAFLLSTYQSPAQGQLIQKPENSKMLVCLVDDPEMKTYTWYITDKDSGELIDDWYTTDNFIILKDGVDTSRFNYSVEVKNTNENSCSSTFYLSDLKEFHTPQN